MITDPTSRALGKIDIEQFLEASKAALGGVWTDISYDELNILGKSNDSEALVPLDIPTLAEYLSELCLHMCNLKTEYKDWCAKRTDTKIPTDMTALKRIREAVSIASRNPAEYGKSVQWKVPYYSSYTKTVDSIPMTVRGVGAVLYSIVEAVSHDPETMASMQSDVTIPDGIPRLGDDDGSIGSTGERPFHMLKQGFLDAIRNLKANVFSIEEGDSLHSRIIRSKDIIMSGNEENSEYSSATSVFAFERDAVFRGQVPRLIGQGGMPLHATIPYMERCIQQTELLTFTSLSAFDFHRYNQLVQFNRLVERGVPPRVDFTGIRRAEEGDTYVSALKRQHFKNIPAVTLPQILAKELLKEPVISREYYPLTDELLLCLYWPPPVRRMAKKIWSPVDNLHLRPSFSEFLILAERQVTKTSVSFMIYP